MHVYDIYISISNADKLIVFNAHLRPTVLTAAGVIVRNFTINCVQQRTALFDRRNIDRRQILRAVTRNEPVINSLMCCEH